MIQPHEITIGSLLRTNTGEIIRVDCIGTKRQNRKVGYHREGDPCHIHYVRLSQCEGIPLTEEILKANKFELHEHELILRRRTSYDEYYHVDFFVTSDYVFALDIECSDKDAKVTRVHKIINYVHQLQSALYLCGLTGLANNFVINPKQSQL